MEELKENKKGQEETVKCEKCGRDEYDAAVFYVRIKGSNTWVCARCLPMLIHG